jgi:hypothetical protein
MDAQLAEVYERWSESIGIESPIPIEDGTRIVSIMTQGFMMNQQIDPELGEELYGTMLATFMLGMREMWRAQDPEAVRRAEERFESMSTTPDRE